MESRAEISVRPHAMEDLCLVAPTPSVGRQLLQRLNELQQSSRAENQQEIAMLESVLHPMAAHSAGLNDGVSRPSSTSRPGLVSRPDSKSPPTRAVHVIVVMVQFPDQKFSGQLDKGHYERLWFAKGPNSVRDYYAEVSGGKVEVQGEVVGPFDMREPLTYYAQGNMGRSPNPDVPSARTLARDAALLANGKVDFSKYTHGDGHVDNFVVVHAGEGAEQTANKNHIWSHKYTLPRAIEVDKSKVYPYLVVPANCSLGLCAHELGHLAFGWPDLYDVSNNLSSGIGNWCLMASGSWNDSGNTPAHPSAWCKVQQGWVEVFPITTPGKSQKVELHDVKDKPHRVVKLWNDHKKDKEYLLAENRQQKGYDKHLPHGGLLLWHIDGKMWKDERTDQKSPGNSSERRNYMIALVQSDGMKQLEGHTRNTGDIGDPFPGSENIRKIDSNTSPNTLAHDRSRSGVSIKNISDSKPVMTFDVSISHLQ